MTQYILPMDGPTASALLTIAAGQGFGPEYVRTTGCGYAVPDAVGDEYTAGLPAREAS